LIGYIFLTSETKLLLLNVTSLLLTKPRSQALHRPVDDTLHKSTVNKRYCIRLQNCMYDTKAC